jgi:hexosaminidase
MDFVLNLYSEVGRLQWDDWIHAGGDEVSLDCWKASAHVHQWLKAHNLTSEVDLLDYFEDALLSFVIMRLHKRPIVWQELFESGLRLPPETIVDVWQNWNDNPVREKATKSHSILVSSCWYLDHLDEDWKSFYECNPRGFNGTERQKARVEGGHASMWGERVDEENFMPRVWPRASATAEKLWTGASSSAAASAAERLVKFRCLMVQRGVAASPIQPGSCATESARNFHATETVG